MESGFMSVGVAGKEKEGKWDERVGEGAATSGRQRSSSMHRRSQAEEQICPGLKCLPKSPSAHPA